MDHNARRFARVKTRLTRFYFVLPVGAHLLSGGSMETVQVGWRLDRDIVEQVQRLAQEEERSIGVVVRRLLKAALKSPSPSFPNGFPPASICINNTPPSLTLSSPPPRNKSIKPNVDERFEVFWKAYPRKVGKAGARRAWEKAMRVTTPEVIGAALGAAKWSEDPKFIPHPETWLNQGRWDDEAPPPRLRDEDIIPL